MLSPRLLGTDTPNLSFQNKTVPTFTPDQRLAQQSAERVSNIVQQSYTTLRESNEQNARVFAEVGRSLTQAAAVPGTVEASENALRAKLVQPSEFAAQAENIGAAAAGGINAVLESYRKAKERKSKLQQEQALLEANKEAEEVLVEAERRLRTTEGQSGYNDTITRFLNKYTPRLPSDAIIELTRRLYAPAKAVSEEQAKARVAKTDEIANTQLETRKAEITIKLSKGLADVRHAADITKREKAIKTVQDDLISLTKELSPEDQLFITASIFQELAEKSLAGSEEQAKIEDTLINIQKYAIAQQQAITQYNESGDKVAFDTTTFYNKQRFGIPASSDVLANPLASIEDGLKRKELIQRLTRLDAEAAITESEKLQVHKDVIASFAYEIYADPSKEALYDTTPGIKDAPWYNQAKALAKARKEYAESQIKTSEQLVGLDIQIINAQQEDLNKWLAWASKSETDAVLQSLGIAARFQQGLKSFVEEYKQGQADPKDIEKVRGLWRQQQEHILKALQAKKELLQSDLAIKAQRLHQYGLGDPEKENGNVKVFSERINSTLELLKKTQDEARQRGVLPNFKPANLKKVQVGKTTTILPFHPNADVVITSHRGDSRGNRLHAGVDIGAAEGTPVIFYSQGTVDYIGRQIDERTGRGYGWLIDIKTPDGHYHRFAHLQQKPNLAVGQSVKPGDDIGKVGDSGSPGAYHLHWEVRKNTHSSYETSLDPIVYGSNIQSNSLNNRDITQTQKPKGATQITNGYIQNSQIHTTGGQVKPANYSVANPIKQGKAPIDKSEYPTKNNPENNYGYRELASRDAFRRELAKTADRLGIPAQWLADVIAVETGSKFSPTITNPSTGAVGLIQFTDIALEDMRVSRREVETASDVAQLKYVEEYLKPAVGKIDSPYHLAMAIWGGRYILTETDETPESFENVSDGHITFKQYAERIGSYAGRQYESYKQRRAVVHTQYQASCPTCQSLMSSSGRIIPHEFA